MLDRDSMLKVQVVHKDDEDNELGASLALELTLGQLADWIHAELDNYAEPDWEV